MLKEDFVQSRDKLLLLLKLNGPQTAQFLADALGLTTAGTRYHLMKLVKKGEIDYEDQHQPVGRPARFYRLAAGA